MSLASHSIWLPQHSGTPLSFRRRHAGLSLDLDTASAIVGGLVREQHAIGHWFEFGNLANER